MNCPNQWFVWLNVLCKCCVKGCVTQLHIKFKDFDQKNMVFCFDGVLCLAFNRKSKQVEAT